ncbi:hypothetical protein DRE_04296 [Drechslerella stenobrocha 248]|uniref:6-phosphogluconolactonase n=1 Tax=Drechslerella stenobrocha 248 TaxID=1043628 RepID=W7I336_9PEZI|nr:hypothetical protein DRE_04296 [Drechslerella stenobrocha 248]
MRFKPSDFRTLAPILAALLWHPSPVHSAKLFVGTTVGVIVSIDFNDSYVNQIADDFNAAPLPTWQTITRSSLLISTNEGPQGGRGSVVSYRITSNGPLTWISKQDALPGAIHAAVSPNGRFVAAASYYSNGVNIYPLSGAGVLGPASQNLTYTLPTPGIVAARQETTHPHQIVFDPSDRFMLVNDLGADLIRIYTVQSSEAGVIPAAEVAVPAGFGPRHGKFLRMDNGGIFYYLVGELANAIATFAVSYTADGNRMNLTLTKRVSTYGPLTPPARNPRVAASGIEISPDKKFLYVSNRGDSSFPGRGGSTPSDSISAWGINPDGSLRFLRLLPAGGSTPRHFSLDQTGQYAAVALQDSNLVAFFQRDVGTGLWPDKPLVAWNSPPGPACVTWL